MLLLKFLLQWCTSAFVAYLFIYLIIEAKQSNAVSKNHNKQVIIVSAAKADEG